METSKENIEKMLNAVSYVFDKYREHKPILTGSLAMHLNGIDFGEVNDIDIMLMARPKPEDVDKMKADLSERFGWVKFNIFAYTVYNGEVLETSVDDITIKYVHHADLYKFLKGAFDMSPNKEKRLRQFKIYDETVAKWQQEEE